MARSMNHGMPVIAGFSKTLESLLKAVTVFADDVDEVLGYSSAMLRAQSGQRSSQHPRRTGDQSHELRR